MNVYSKNGYNQWSPIPRPTGHLVTEKLTFLLFCLLSDSEEVFFCKITRFSPPSLSMTHSSSMFVSYVQYIHYLLKEAAPANNRNSRASKVNKKTN